MLCEVYFRFSPACSWIPLPSVCPLAPGSLSFLQQHRTRPCLHELSYGPALDSSPVHTSVCPPVIWKLLNNNYTWTAEKRSPKMNALSRSCFTSVYILHKVNTPYFRTIKIHCMCHYFYDIKAHSHPAVVTIMFYLWVCNSHYFYKFVKKKKHSWGSTCTDRWFFN